MKYYYMVVKSKTTMYATLCEGSPVQWLINNDAESNLVIVYSEKITEEQYEDLSFKILANIKENKL